MKLLTSVSLMALSAIWANAGPVQALLKDYTPGDMMVIDYTSTGCFHSSRYILSIRESSNGRTTVEVKKMPVLSARSGTESPPGTEVVPLTHADVKRLHNLFAFYDALPGESFCTTTNTVRISRSSDGKVVQTVEVTDGTCSLWDRADLLSVEEIVERAEIMRNRPNQSLQPTATAVMPPAAQEIMPAVAVAEH